MRALVSLSRRPRPPGTIKVSSGGAASRSACASKLKPDSATKAAPDQPEQRDPIAGRTAVQRLPDVVGRGESIRRTDQIERGHAVEPEDADADRRRRLAAHCGRTCRCLGQRLLGRERCDRLRPLPVGFDIDATVFGRGAGRKLAEVIVALPVVRRAHRPRAEAPAAVGAHVAEHRLDAGAAERAFEAADHGLVRSPVATGSGSVRSWVAVRAFGSSIAVIVLQKLRQTCPAARTSTDDFGHAESGRAGIRASWIPPDPMTRREGRNRRLPALMRALGAGRCFAQARVSCTRYRTRWRESDAEASVPA